MSEHKPILSTPERKEKGPKLEYTFLFSSHMTAEDFRQLEGLFAECDVYVPELTAWQPEFIEAIRQLSEGEISLNEFIDTKTGLNRTPWDTGNRERYRIIAGSHKPIFIADVPMSEEYPRVRNTPAFQLAQESGIFLKAGLVEEAIEKKKQSIRQYAESFRKREGHIAKMLKEPLHEFIINIPELKNKGNVKVLVQLGSGHTRPYHKLKTERVKAQRNFNIDPVIYSLNDAAIRKLLFDPEAEITDEEAKLSIIGSRINSELYRKFEQSDIGKDTDLLAVTSARITRSLTSEQVERYFEDLKNKVPAAEAFTNLGNVLPSTAEELEKIAHVRQKSK